MLCTVFICIVSGSDLILFRAIHFALSYSFQFNANLVSSTTAFILLFVSVLVSPSVFADSECQQL